MLAVVGQRQRAREIVQLRIAGRRGGQVVRAQHGAERGPCVGGGIHAGEQAAAGDHRDLTVAGSRSPVALGAAAVAAFTGAGVGAASAAAGTASPARTAVTTGMRVKTMPQA